MYRQRPSFASRFFIVSLLGSIAWGGYYLHKKQELLGNEISSLQEARVSRDLEVVTRKPVVIGSENKSNWIDVQKKAKDAVVQVFTQQANFNWLEPYKSPAMTEGAGSGFFINENGDLLTNYHVVEAGSSIEIQIPALGKQRLGVSIIGVSPERDIALLRLNEEAKIMIKSALGGIPYIKLGSSDSLVKMQETLAIGYPLGQQSIKTTQGVISGQENLGGQTYIQITTPINPGNSGGPLLDQDGEAVGINSVGVPGAQNVGYIIPMSEVKSAINDLYKVKLLRKPVLGAVFIPTSSDLNKHLGNPTHGGYYIARVFDGGLFKRVGVQPGDTIYEINGHKVDVHGEVNVGWAEEKVSMLALINRYVVGDDIHLVAYRGGDRTDFRFKLQLSERMPIRRMFPEFEKIDYEIFGGMVVMELTVNHIVGMLSMAPQLSKFTKIGAQDKSSLIITSILPDSAAARTRCLMPGAIIEEVNGAAVVTLQEFREAVLKTEKSEFMTVKVEDSGSKGILTALPVKKILAQEDILSQRYFYKVSSLVDKFKGSSIA